MSHRVPLFCLAVFLVGGAAVRPALSDQRDIDIAARVPPNSALPPPGSVADDALPKTAGIRKFEDKMKGWEVRPVTDPGNQNGSESMHFQILDYVGATDPLPFASSSAVVLADVSASSAHLADHRTAVYSTYTVNVVQSFRGSSAQPVAPGTSLTLCQLGGSLQFPSGHISHYVIYNSGFLAVRSPYLLFLNTIDEPTHTYEVAAAYLIKDGKVYPLERGGAFAPLSGAPLETVISGHTFR